MWHHFYISSLTISRYVAQYSYWVFNKMFVKMNSCMLASNCILSSYARVGFHAGHASTWVLHYLRKCYFWCSLFAFEVSNNKHLLWNKLCEFHCERNLISSGEFHSYLAALSNFDDNKKIIIHPMLSGESV